MPSYYGFNIANFTIGAYTYNFKFEDKIPYVYYKESADTVMILDKKSNFEYSLMTLPDNVRTDMFSQLMGNQMEDFQNQVRDFCSSVNVPKKTKTN
jgi:hypothetical protein